MLFDDSDINFHKLFDSQFEELCFEMLMKLGFVELLWRLGGADSGRDIEGKLILSNQLIGSYEEKYFFECKRYEKGVPPEDLNSKIAWADAEKPKHLVFFISSYLTNNARTWLEKIQVDKPYRIHLIEGKKLKDMVLKYPDIVSRFFVDQYSKLMLESRKNWLIHDLLPEPETLSLLVKNLNIERLTADELAFIWCAAKIKSSDLEKWMEDNEHFSLDFMFKHITRLSNCKEPILINEENIFPICSVSGIDVNEICYPKYYAAKIVIKSNNSHRKAMYSFVRDSEGEGLEVLIEATSDFKTKLRYVKRNASKEMKDAVNKFNSLFTKERARRQREDKGISVES